MNFIICFLQPIRQFLGEPTTQLLFAVHFGHRQQFIAIITLQTYDLSHLLMPNDDIVKSTFCINKC